MRLTFDDCFALVINCYAVPVQVHLFAKVPDGEIMDDISFTLPIMKELGDQVEITSKAVLHLDSTTA